MFYGAAMHSPSKIAVSGLGITPCIKSQYIKEPRHDLKELDMISYTYSQYIKHRSLH